MDQKVTFDLLRLAGLLGFSKKSRNNRLAGREIDSVFNTLALNVSSLLRSYKEIEDQNLKLKEELSLCRCRGQNASQSSQGNDERRKSSDDSASSPAGQIKSQTEKSAINSSDVRKKTDRETAGNSSASNGVDGGAVGYSGGATVNSVVPLNNAAPSNGGSVDNGLGQQSGTKGLMRMAKAEMLQAGYELRSLLGRGAFSVVFNGRTLKTPTQEVAIKFSKFCDIHTWTTSSSETRKGRIPVEAAALLELKPVKSVVDLLSFGKVHLGDNDFFIFVMEKPAGCLPFDSYLKKYAPLCEPTAFFFLKQLVSMVMAIHRCGWVHGDLKPSNLLVTAQGHLKAIDLGQAMQIANDKCIENIYGGTPFWSEPPEKVDGPCDLVKSTVWSLGTMYYYMIFEQVPFRSPAHAKAQPFKWHHNVSGVSMNILLRLLDPDPSRRIVIQDLHQLIQTYPPTNNMQ